MKVYTTKSSFNCGPCAFINLAGIKANKEIEMGLSRTGKLKPFKASSYSAFLVWAKEHNVDLTIYTCSKKLNNKMFDLMIRHEKIPKKLQTEYKAAARKRFNGLNKKFSSMVKALDDPMNKLDALLAAGNRVAVLTSSFYMKNGKPSVPHWIVAYKKEGDKYFFMCSRDGLITLSKKDLLKGFKINKRQGYNPVLVAHKVNSMKILVIGDLHGRRPVIKDRDFGCMVLVGDICDDRKIAPIYKKWFRELKKVGATDTSLDFEAFASKILGSRKKLESYEKMSVEEGNKVLKYLDSFGKPIFMVGGNWDQSYGKSRIKNLDASSYSYLKWFYDSWAGDEINSNLIKGTKNVHNCMLHNAPFGGINFVGYGLSSAPESFGKRKNGEYSKKQVEKLKRAHDRIVGKLEGAHKGRKNKRLPTFFISHNIPNGTKLDRVMDKKSYAYGKHLGSTIARKFCTKFKPVVCVGGHIHDHPGRDKLGKTLLINPGYGKRAQVMIDFDSKKGRVKSVKFLS